MDRGPKNPITKFVSLSEPRQQEKMNSLGRLSFTLLPRFYPRMSPRCLDEFCVRCFGDNLSFNFGDSAPRGAPRTPKERVEKRGEARATSTMLFILWLRAKKGMLDLLVGSLADERVLSPPADC